MRLLVALVLLCSARGQTSSTARALFEAKLMERVRSIDARLDGVLGVYAIDLTDGHSLGYHGNTVVAQASSIKIPILVELFRQARAGKFLLSDTLTLQPSE